MAAFFYYLKKKIFLSNYQSFLFKNIITAGFSYYLKIKNHSSTFTVLLKIYFEIKNYFQSVLLKKRISAVPKNFKLRFQEIKLFFDRILASKILIKDKELNLITH